MVPTDTSPPARNSARSSASIRRRDLATATIVWFGLAPTACGGATTPSSAATPIPTKQPTEHVAAPQATPQAEARPAAAASNTRQTATDLTRVGLRQIDTDGQPGFDTLAVTFDIEPGWHIYWINPGDSGLTTRVDVSTSPNATATDVAYPAPERFVGAGDIVGYGYADRTALFVPITATGEATTAAARAEVRWLVCRESCLRGKQTLDTTLVQDPTAADPALRTIWDRIPKAASELAATSTWEAANDKSTLQVVAADVVAVAFFPYATDPIALVETQFEANTITLAYRTAASEPWPTTGQGVVHVRRGGRDEFYELARPWPQR